MGNLKITFETLPILLGALLLGPLDGMLIGGIGTLVYQLLRYGVSATTLLWMLPYIVCGALVGIYAKYHRFSLSQRQLLLAVIASELLVTALNTGVLYLDSVIYGYYSPAYIFGTLALRVALSIGKGAALALLLPVLLRAADHTIRPRKAGGSEEDD